MIKESIDFEDFLKEMVSLDYEIKQGKHIAFKHKDNKRFTRAKTIGIGYSEDEIRERINNKNKEFGTIIDLRNNTKAKESSAYDQWIHKHNLKTASESLLQIRRAGFNSMIELERAIHSLRLEINEDKKKFDRLDFKQKRIKEISKDLEICIKKKAHYDGYRKNPNDKIYWMMNKKDIENYKEPYERLEVSAKQFPELKSILKIKNDKETARKLFSLLNKESKKAYSTQEQMIKDNKDKVKELKRLQKLKTNLDDYMGRNEPQEKQSTLEEIKKFKEQEKQREHSNVNRSNEMER